MNRKLKKMLPTIMTAATITGIIFTTVTAVKATPKALELLKKAEKEKGERLTVWEKIKTTAPTYIPTVIIGALTIACVVETNILNEKQKTAYISAYTALSSSYRQYKDKVTELYGENADYIVEDEILKEKAKATDLYSSDEKITFFEEHYGDFFELSKEELLMAEYHLNRNFILRGYTTLNEFYEFLGLPKTEIGDKLGWSADSGWAFYGYSWIDFEHKKHHLDDGMEYYSISFPFPPTLDYEDPDLYCEPSYPRYDEV